MNQTERFVSKDTVLNQTEMFALCFKRYSFESDREVCFLFQKKEFHIREVCFLFERYSYETGREAFLFLLFPKIVLNETVLLILCFCRYCIN